MHSYYQGYVLTNIYWFASRIMQKYTQRGKETLWIHYQRTEAKLARLLWEGDQDYFFWKSNKILHHCSRPGSSANAKGASMSHPPFISGSDELGGSLG